MARISSLDIFILILGMTSISAYDDVDEEFRDGVMGKLLRAMVNQTQAETLDLPANSTSIRENITDTFSCENRTYGYYADVDNDCQVFHVCLPTRTARGRSVVYRWSFICPAETVFNQEVLVCTRPRDAIECEDSPMYYDVNLDIGKVPENDTNAESVDDKDKNAIEENNEEPAEKTRVKQRRKPINKRKQNIIIQSLMKEAVDKDFPSDVSDFKSFVSDIKPKVEAIGEVLPGDVNFEDFEDSRIVAERSLKRRNRKMKRGMFRFTADV